MSESISVLARREAAGDLTEAVVEAERRSQGGNDPVRRRFRIVSSYLNWLLV